MCGSQPLERAVGRSVVDDDHLPRPAVERRARTLEQLVDRALLVQDGDDDRDLGLLGHRRTSSTTASTRSAHVSIECPCSTRRRSSRPVARTNVGRRRRELDEGAREIGRIAGAEHESERKPVQIPGKRGIRGDHRDRARRSLVDDLVERLRPLTAVGRRDERIRSREQPRDLLARHRLAEVGIRREDRAAGDAGGEHVAVLVAPPPSCSARGSRGGHRGPVRAPARNRRAGSGSPSTAPCGRVRRAEARHHDRARSVPRTGRRRSHVRSRGVSSSRADTRRDRRSEPPRTGDRRRAASSRRASACTRGSGARDERARQAQRAEGTAGPCARASRPGAARRSASTAARS